MLLLYLQVGLLVILSVLIISLVSRKIFTALLSVLFGLFISLQIGSVLIGGNIIDHKFFEHFSIDNLPLALEVFTSQSTIVALAAIGIPFMLFFISRYVLKLKVKKRFTYSALLIILVGMCLHNGMLYQLYHFSVIKLTPDKSIDQALSDLGIDPAKYVFPRDLKAKKGKNIIVISLESVEKGFLSDEHLLHLTPNLRKMAREMTLFEMQPAPGSGWTSASIYTEMTGVPAYFKSAGFQSSQSFQLSHIGQILKKAEYRQIYLAGNKEFTGLDDMLTAFNFQVLSERDFSEKYKIGPWGVQDKDLFTEAKKLLISKKDTTSPLALFISTCSTHGPDGVYDPRMEEHISPQKSKLEFMIAAVDHMIGDLMEFLKEENLSENTSIFIFPDHLLHGFSARALEDLSEPRSLYLITNSSPEALSYHPSDTIFQMDIPKLILEGAGIHHNARFLTDFIPKDKSAFIETHKSNILALNEAARKTASFEDGFVIRTSVFDRNSFELKGKEHQIKITGKNIEPGWVHYLDFDEDFHILTKHIINEYQAFNRSDYTYQLIVDISDNKIQAYLKYKGIICLVKEGQSSVEFSKAEIYTISNSEVLRKATEFSRHAEYHSPYNNIFLTSSSFGPQRFFTPSQIKIGDTPYPVPRGVTVLTKEKNGHRTKGYDTFGDSSATSEFIQRLDSLRKTKDFFALVVDDSGELQLKPYRKKLQQMGFPVLSKLQHRHAYIGYSFNGLISEYTDERTISLALPESFSSARTKEEIQQNAKDVNRFIAHAGGEINGHTYTNSLEALNNSYKKGFRLFELDIIKTLDNKFVAAHDWNNWKAKTGYKGDVPVSAEEFLKHRIHGEYSPLDMEAINTWFSQHPDAILVTDKINEPMEFSGQFIDKQRLMMELFSLEALQEGLSAGILSAMPSENMINGLKGDKVSQLKNLGVRHIAVSRRMLHANREFFLRLQDADILTYVFHVNHDVGKDEAFVVLQDMDFIYGLYADKWNFTIMD